MAISKTSDHETVSIYPFTDEEVDQMCTHSSECVLMWTTKDGWPVGVTHAFVWHDNKIWLTFTVQRHRAKAIKRDGRVSVNISSCGYPAGASADLPTGAITFKGTAEFHEDEETRDWFYHQLAAKVGQGNQEATDAFYGLLQSPLRTLISVTPVKKIMYNSGLAARHWGEGVDESELGAPLESDTVRLAREREERDLPAKN